MYHAWEKVAGPKMRRKKKRKTLTPNKVSKLKIQPLSPITRIAVDKEQAVKQELVKMSKIVRNKFRDLKKDADSVERYFEVNTKPFVSPIIEGIKKSMPLPMIDMKQSVKQESSSPVKQQVKRKKPRLTRVLVSASDDSDDATPRKKLKAEKGKANASTSTQSGPDSELVDSYMAMFQTPLVRNMMDTTYGIRLDGQGGTVIGDSAVSFAKGKISVQDQTFDITPGLMELLFKKVPDREKVQSDALRDYKKILQMTNAHRQMYSAEKPINATKGLKYTTVISQIFPAKSRKPVGKVVESPSMSGSGISERYRNSHININTLVNRLRLLTLSKAAGHTAHGTEINRIIGLLRQYKVIG